MTYKTRGTCSTLIDLEVEEGIVKNVKFTNGCNGNLQGISRLVEGMKAEDERQQAESLYDNTFFYDYHMMSNLPEY